jgi:hypothetical protein
MKRNQIIVGVIVAVVAIVGLFITEPWTYFVVNEVDEAFPSLSSDQREAMNNMPEDQKNELIAMAEDNPEMAEDVAVAQIGDDTVVPEDEQDMPDDMPDEPTVLKSGTFITIDPVHGAEGSATIYELPEGDLVLRFEDFTSTNGPELHVILSKDVPTSTFAGVGEDSIDLGLLKGNVGNQNYEISADIDLDEYKSIVIYCVPFGVVFSSADLSA